MAKIQEMPETVLSVDFDRRTILPGVMERFAAVMGKRSRMELRLRRPFVIDVGDGVDVKVRSLFVYNGPRYDWKGMMNISSLKNKS